MECAVVEFAILQYIQAAHKTPFSLHRIILPMPAKSSILKTASDTPSSSGIKSFSAVKLAKLGVIRGIHHMVTVGFCADRQIPQILQRDDTAVGIDFILHLHAQETVKGNLLHFVQCCKLCGKVVELVETDIQLL